MNTFVALRPQGGWTFDPDYEHALSYVELKWASYLPSQDAIVDFHKKMSIPMMPVAKLVSDEIIDGDLELQIILGCEFERPDHAMLFKLTFGGEL